jgi:hypothetical protein
MANSVTTQIIEQGPLNYVLRVTGTLDTSDYARTRIVQVSALAPSCTSVALWEVNTFSISSQLTVTLDWDASTPVKFLQLVSTGNPMKFERYGGIPNNGGAGVTGDVYITTTGWASGTQSFTLVLWFKKQGTSYGSGG